MKWSKYDKKYQIEGHFKSVKFQLLVHCFMNNIELSDAELNLLTLFSINGVEDEVKSEALKKKFFRSKNSINNAVTKFSQLDLLVKKNKRKQVNPELDIVTNPLIVGAIRVINLDSDDPQIN